MTMSSRVVLVPIVLSIRSSIRGRRQRHSRTRSHLTSILSLGGIPDGDCATVVVDGQIFSTATDRSIGESDAPATPLAVINTNDSHYHHDDDDAVARMY